MTLSRRRVLAAMAVAGSAGALGKGATGAVLGDEWRSAAEFTTGVVDLVAEYWRLTGPGGSGVDLDDSEGRVDGPRLNVPIGPLTEDEPTGSTLLRFSLPQDGEGVNNPASLWLRTACPAPTSLAELLRVRLSYADADGVAGAEIAAGSLREVADALRTGVRLDPDGDPTDDEHGCLTDDLFVLVEYDLGAYVGSETTTLPLVAAAVQCRNADRTASPFPADSIAEECDVGHTCECCWAVGKVEVERPLDVGQTYPFDEGSDDYAIHVTAVDGDEGVAFEVVAADGGPVPPLCSVLVKGGPESVVYERDDEWGPDTGVLEGTSDGLVYAPENDKGGKPGKGAKPGKRYGISHVLVRLCVPRLDGGNCPEDLARTSADGRGDDGHGRGTDHDWDDKKAEGKKGNDWWSDDWRDRRGNGRRTK